VSFSLVRNNLRGLRGYLKHKNRALAVTHGQYEVEPQKMSPYLPGAALITESMITKLNQDIQVSF
jgi:hypothetical protein